MNSYILLLFSIFKLISSFDLLQNLRILPHNQHDDDESSCTIENCSTCKRESILRVCKECNEGFYLNILSRCSECSDGCKRCFNSNYCYSCKDDYELYYQRCQKKMEDSEENETNYTTQTNKIKEIKNCIIYFSDSTCEKCRNGYKLKGNECKSNLETIISVCVISVIVLVIIVTLISCFIVRRNKRKMLLRLGVRNSNQIINENEKSKIKDIVNTEANNISVRSDASNQLTCFKCEREPAVYQLSCGCCFCKKDIGIFEGFNDRETFEKFNGKDAKCEICSEIVTQVKELKYECGICLELKHHIYRLNCGCNFELCRQCYNKLEIKQCPGCRKKFDALVPINRDKK